MFTLSFHCSIGVSSWRKEYLEGAEHELYVTMILNEDLLSCESLAQMSHSAYIRYEILQSDGIMSLSRIMIESRQTWSNYYRHHGSIWTYLE